MAGAPVGAVPGTINAPEVVGPPIGITQSRIYRASVRLPQPNLPGAMGRPTEANIRYSLAAAGQIAQVDTGAGVRRLVLIDVSQPIER